MKKTLSGLDLTVSILDKMATMPSDEEHSLKEVEAYVKKYEIQQTLKECIVQLCISKPDKPFAFLRDYFDRLDKVCSFAYFFLLSQPRLQRCWLLRSESVTLVVNIDMSHAMAHGYWVVELWLVCVAAQTFACFFVTIVIQSSLDITVL